MRGVPLAAFVRQAALREAAGVAAEINTVTLSKAEAMRLLAAIDKPFKPNQRLRRALDWARGRGVVDGGVAPTVAVRLRGRATTRFSTDEIMRLTRGA